ncbi:hypothetical protein AGABI2DRAFT_70302, partial [Agaricus bisporus var. bisporus H97]|uniref:hypothetical protein n=1 Tax=Agaricus bisporus var. bisporus (strain H97 / ATCC MYA-4626 / FGSC 10389) TaxID=936046 RepID=UPI00029F556D
PFTWVENPEIISLFDTFLSQAQEMKDASGGYATIQGDGWTGRNDHHLIALMIRVDGKLYIIKVHDASSECKTAVNFVKLLKEVHKEVEEHWKCKVVAVVTDASGETRKAQQDFGKEFPHIIMLDCYAHQINLIVGDYLKSNNGLLNCIDQAHDLISWLRSKTLILALIRDAQSASHQPTTSVIRPVLTRWTSHLRAFERLESLENVLRSIISNDLVKLQDQRQIFNIGDRKTQAKADKMGGLIQDGHFWKEIKRVIKHLQPLGVAANTTQSTGCRLDTVLLIFGYLLHSYSRLMMDSSDIPGCKAIINSLESRWFKADQDLFVAAVILNPIYSITPFRPLDFLIRANIHQLYVQLYTRIYLAPPPADFLNEAYAYINGNGKYVGLKSMIAVVKHLAMLKVSHIFL